MNRYLEIGKIVGTHGIKGELRVQPWCDGYDFFEQFDILYLDNKGEQSIEIAASRLHGNIILIKLDMVSTVEQAMTYRGKTLYMDRTEADIGDRVFIQDLIDCAVYDSTTNELYGKITDVTNNGANDIWHITNGKDVYLVPAIPHVVDLVDVENSMVKITPIKGLFGDDN